MNNAPISGGLYIPEGVKIVDLYCEILPEENSIVRNIQYQSINGVVDIVDSVSRRRIFNLSNNPNVTQIDLPDHGLMYHVTYTEPGNEISAVYRVDKDTNYVYKVSHLILKLSDGTSKYIISQNPISYINILNYLKDCRPNVVDTLLVRVGGIIRPFLDLDPECEFSSALRDDQE